MLDLYHLFLGGILLGLAILILFISLKKFEFAIILIFISPLLSSIISFYTGNSIADQEEAGIGSIVRISLLIFAGSIGLIKYIQYLMKDQGKIPLQFIFLGIFIIFALVSAYYSLDQRYTLIRSLSFIALYFFLLGFYHWLDQHHRLLTTFRIFYITITVVIVLNLFAFVISPTKVWGIDAEFRFQGIFDNPNAIGSFGMICYPLLLWALYRSNRYHKLIPIILLSILAIMHILSGSRSSILVSMIGICLLLILQKKMVKLVTVFAVLFIALFLIIQIKPASFQRQEDRSITDLTGREDFWKNAFILISERPYHGYGYSVGGKIWQDPRFYNPKISLWSGSVRSSLHNGYLSVAIGLGMPALILWIIILILPLYKSLKNKTNHLNPYIITMLAMILIINFVETEITPGTNVSAIIFWFGWTIAGKMYPPELLN